MAKFSLGNILAEQGARAPAQSERTIEVITSEILEAKRVGGEAVLTIGRGLIEAKGLLSHGEWLPWLSEKVEFSERSAQNFMRLAREWSNPQTLADLGASKALALLALPESEREDFIAEVHTVDGEEKTVIDMSARQLEKAIREREEALAEKHAAEQARAKMAEDMALTKQLLESAQETAKTSGQEVDRLTRELEKLKSRPVEVAVEVDRDALDKAREEGYQQAKKEFKTAEKAAGEQVSKANAAAAQVKTELEQARREIENLKFEAERAGTPSPLTSDTELAQFKLLFDQAQTIVNQMRGLYLKVRGRDNGEDAGKLAAALKALAECVGRCAE